MTGLTAARIPRAAVAVVAALLVCGCFQYEESLVLNDDGSGTVTINAWIDAETAAKFYTPGDEEQVPPPVNLGVVQNMLLGSSKVNLEDDSIYLEEGRWVYEISIYFESLEDLSRTNFFKNRALSLSYVTARRVRLRETLRPDIVRMARDRAEILKVEQYGAKFVEAFDGEGFAQMISPAALTYSVEMRGVGGSGNADAVDTLPGTRIRGTWDFTEGDLFSAETPQRLELIADLPPERGFNVMVVALLVGSLAGVLVAAIRLVILKIQRVS